MPDFPVDIIMYQTREIRWFTKPAEKQLIDWFAQYDERFETVPCREDFYLPPGRDEQTIKLREGNIEIKERIGATKKGTLPGNNKGYFEDWVKWSFDANDRDKLMREITEEQKYRWIKTTKWRMGKKIKPDKNGLLRIHDINEELAFGCQIEYTRLRLSRSVYYSFAFEWFGPKQIPLPEKILQELLSGCSFRQADSMGYGKLLRLHAP